MGSGCRKLLRECSTVAGESLPCCEESVKLTSLSMISYPNYKFIFPIKALGMYSKIFGDEEML